MLRDEEPFLSACGIALPAVANDDPLDYEAFARLFLSPGDIPSALVERLHLTNQLYAPQPGRAISEDHTPPTELTPLEDEPNDWYAKRKRGRSARVFWRQKDTEFWFYIRHAEPIKREGCVGLKDNQSGGSIDAAFADHRWAIVLRQTLNSNEPAVS